jgi:hypothetical protein
MRIASKVLTNTRSSQISWFFCIYAYPNPRDHVKSHSRRVRDVAKRSFRYMWAYSMPQSPTVKRFCISVTGQISTVHT